MADIIDLKTKTDLSKEIEIGANLDLKLSDEDKAFMSEIFSDYMNHEISLTMLFEILHNKIRIHIVDYDKHVPYVTYRVVINEEDKDKMEFGPIYTCQFYPLTDTRKK